MCRRPIAGLPASRGPLRVVLRGRPVAPPRRRSRRRSAGVAGGRARRAHRRRRGGPQRDQRRQGLPSMPDRSPRRRTGPGAERSRCRRPRPRPRRRRARRPRCGPGRSVVTARSVTRLTAHWTSALAAATPTASSPIAARFRNPVASSSAIHASSRTSGSANSRGSRRIDAPNRATMAVNLPSRKSCESYGAYWLAAISIRSIDTETTMASSDDWSTTSVPATGRGTRPGRRSRRRPVRPRSPAPPCVASVP